MLNNALAVLCLAFLLALMDHFGIAPIADAVPQFLFGLFVVMFSISAAVDAAIFPPIREFSK